ncbi:MAG TPA: DNA starvation/stationary phase protection protein Dps [Chroococcales cyanobacterium]
MANSTKEAQKLYKTHNDLPERTRTEVVEILNESLAATLDLWSQVKQAHWNVKGKDFYQLHLLFDEIASELYEFVDTLAERVTALGGVAMGTVRMSAKASLLSEYPTSAVNGKDHINALVNQFGLYVKHIRQNIDKTDELGDKNTADIYTEISRAVDARLWFLEAHVQGE